MLVTRSIGEDHMSKGYWVGAYRSISDPTALASYAKLAGPAVEAAGGRFLARGGTVKTAALGGGAVRDVRIVEGVD